MKKNIITVSCLFLFEEILNLVGGEDGFLEGVGIGLGRADHADYLSVAFTGSGFQGSNNFLCHSTLSPIFI